jgi:hypothetical protein
MSKLKVQELESRIAPSVGLFTFLSGLAEADAGFGEVFNSVVDADGNVDTGGAADAVNNSDLGVNVSPVQEDFQLSDDIIIPDSTAETIMSFFGN